LTKISLSRSGTFEREIMGIPETIVEAALIGLEAQRRQIDEQIENLKTQMTRGRGPHRARSANGSKRMNGGRTTTDESIAARVKGTMTAAGRARIAAAQRARHARERLARQRANRTAQKEKSRVATAGTAR